MLVKKSIVEKWYHRDSFVYRNFCYLFVNPLWEKRIPEGFTVCPYFWMSMFSLLIFRPFFVAPIKYIVLPIINAIGKPAHAADKAIYNAIKSIEFLAIDRDYFKGSGFFLVFIGLLLCAAITLIGFVLVGIAIMAYVTLATTNLGVFTFYSMLSFAILFGIICLHKLFTKTKCKTMYYLVVWAVIFAISAFVFVPTETAAIIGNVASSIGHVFASIAIGIWSGIVASSIFLWAWTKFIFLWKPIAAFMLPWWSYIVGLTVLGWLVDKISCYYAAKENEYIRKTNPNQIYAIYRSAWIENFITLLLMNSAWSKNSAWSDEISDAFIYDAAKELRPTLLRAAFETMWKNELDKLQHDYPTFPKEVLNNVKADIMGTDSRFRIVRDSLINKYPDFPTMDVDKFTKIFIQEMVNNVAVQNLALHYRKQYQAEQAKAEAKQTSWSHTTCLKVTNNIANAVKTVVRGLKTTVVQTGTFFAYLWMLVKAKKQGACPYFRFTDSSEK